MTVTLNLPPEMEARLEAVAERENLPVSEYVAHLVEKAIPSEALPEEVVSEEDLPEIRRGRICWHIGNKSDLSVCGRIVKT